MPHDILLQISTRFPITIWEQTLFPVHDRHKEQSAPSSDRPPVHLCGLSISYLYDMYAVASKGTFLILLDCVHGPKLTRLHRILEQNFPTAVVEDRKPDQ